MLIHKRNTVFFLICAAALIGLDRIAKIMVDTYMELGSSIVVIAHFFNIRYVANTGVAFSNFEGSRIITVLMPILIAVMMILFVLRYGGKLSRAAACTLGVIAGGGIGNLIDRFVYGYVVDFLSFGSFAVFNIADIGITAGCICLMLLVIFSKDRSV